MALTYELAELAAVGYGLLVALLWPFVLMRETRVSENSSTLKGLAEQIGYQLANEDDKTLNYAVSTPELKDFTPPAYRIYVVKNGQAFMITISRA